MKELEQAIHSLLSDKLYQIIISSPRSRDGAFKIKIRPILIKGELVFQEAVYQGTQVFHTNREKEDMCRKILIYMEQDFKQLAGESTSERVTVLTSKKGKCTIKTVRKVKEDQESANRMPVLAHNRSKRYILQEGTPIPFLVELGVQTKEGAVVRSRYDKWRQINRYLEFVEDILPILPKNQEIRIVDFGCGKSYLTFALYYYLHELKGYDISVTGLDLKKDVIAHCSKLAAKYGYQKLKFRQGDIAEYKDESRVDMVVTLHACDTATDYAIKKAVDWEAKVIFAVPCCQHEINKQIENEFLAPVLKYGLIKERMSALLTDAIRAELLREMGYDTQILEFIDMEHTPKNILIRAVRSKKSEAQEKESQKARSCGIKGMTDQLHVETTLQKLFYPGE